MAFDRNAPQSFDASPAWQQLRLEVWRKSKGRCWYCGRGTRWSGPVVLEQFCVGHLVPRSAGGTDALDNLVPACRACNARKGRKSLEEFRLHEARRFGPVYTAADVPCYPTVTFWFEDRKSLEDQQHQAAADATAWQAELAARVAQARREATARRKDAPPRPRARR